MTLEWDREAKVYVGSCDHCSHYEELDAHDFTDAVHQARLAGLLPYKDGNARWRHKCATCREKEEVKKS